MNIEKEENERKVSVRNKGIDLLRCVSMLMVIVLHILGAGGVLSSTEGIKNNLIWIIEIGSYCAVDCYAIISGYVGFSDIKRQYNRLYKVLVFWIRVVTYSFGITFLVFIIKPQAISIKILVKSMFPIASVYWWYVSAYMGLLFFKPWLDKFLRECDKKECLSLLKGIIILDLYLTFSNKWGDCFEFSNGYSVLWLIILYLTGAVIKKCELTKYFKKKKMILGIMGCILLSWSLKVFIPEHTISELLINYTSIVVSYIAFALVIIFSQLRISKKTEKVIACFTPAVFGCYLIHMHPIIYENLIIERFTWIANLDLLIIPFAILICATGIFFVCILVEKIRLRIFEFLKIDKIIKQVANTLDNQERKILK